ncbi:MAG TPA: tRNA (guanosine(37)-N1)-methyltransferase TrmD, partial [Thermoanaerobaculia bacterium]|nr:tRNA (guanosine(37)-N1)-methyltransferase TrmD [Thermoanaerobaculia bacterium]
PPLVEGLPVPEVLLSGDHAAIRRWRREQALAATRAKRPDLLAEG